MQARKNSLIAMRIFRDGFGEPQTIVAQIFQLWEGYGLRAACYNSRP
jgi:hypothetical protein